MGTGRRSPGRCGRRAGSPLAWGLAALSAVGVACAGAGYGPPRDLELRSHGHPKPLGFDAGSCRGWLDPALTFPDADDPRILVAPGAPLESRCENPLPGYGGEMLSTEPVAIPAWISGRVRVEDEPGARYAFFLYDDGHEVTVELDRRPEGWRASFVTFRPHPDPERGRILATHASHMELDSLDAAAWHTVSIHRRPDGVEAYLDGRILGRATPDGCRVRPRCLPEGPLRLRVNAWAPAGWGLEELASPAEYRIAWTRVGAGPRAAFAIDPETLRAGREARFDGRRSGTTGPRRIGGWSWRFGDGSSGEGAEVTHRYDSPGRYMVTLVVSDGEGARDTASRELTVGPPRAPDPPVSGDVRPVETARQPGGAMHLDPPVNRFSEAAEIEEWIRELRRLKDDPELQGDDHQRDIQRHLNDARTWLSWDLHRRVMEGGEDVAEVLREVGAHDREPGDPPPEESDRS